MTLRVIVSVKVSHTAHNDLWHKIVLFTEILVPFIAGKTLTWPTRIKAACFVGYDMFTSKCHAIPGEHVR